MTIRAERSDLQKRGMSQGLRDMVALSSLGYQLLAVVLACFGAGYGIDRMAGTGPAFSVVLGLLGIVAGLFLVLRSFNAQSQKRNGKHEF